MGRKITMVKKVLFLRSNVRPPTFGKKQSYIRLYEDYVYLLKLALITVAVILVNPKFPMLNVFFFKVIIEKNEW